MRPARPPAQFSQKISLSFTRKPGLKVCGFHYATHIKAPYYTNLILKEPRHVLWHVMRERIHKRNHDELFWNVTANAMAAKKVIRVKLCRRIRAAMVEVLKEQGYHGNGKHKEETGLGLRGSLEIYALEPLMTTDHVALKQQMGLLLDYIRAAAQNSSPVRKTNSGTNTLTALRTKGVQSKGQLGQLLDDVRADVPQPSTEANGGNKNKDRMGTKTTAPRQQW
jgi:hypothetical protein